MALKSVEEKRSSVRVNKNLTLRVVLIDRLSGKPLNNILEGILYNINSAGIYAEISFPDSKVMKSFFSNSFDILLEIRSVEEKMDICPKAELVWRKEGLDSIDNLVGCGFKFAGLSEKEISAIESLKVKERGGFLSLGLFIDGKDIDTGSYDYFPYTDKAITDFKNTYRIIYQLKKGLIPDSYKEYICAKYCVGDDSDNLKALESAYKASLTFKKFPISIRKKILVDVHDLLIENSHPAEACVQQCQGWIKF